mmetsp:Transcript_39155/g.83449  ORF Transcript_39155/g.83449 Transcript_39155/m.83449 type:complete len:231 (+) Transcript_39155:429-1121(+)
MDGLPNKERIVCERSGQSGGKVAQVRLDLTGCGCSGSARRHQEHPLEGGALVFLGERDEDIDLALLREAAHRLGETAGTARCKLELRGRDEDGTHADGDTARYRLLVVEAEEVIRGERAHVVPRIQYHLCEIAHVRSTTYPRLRRKRATSHRHRRCLHIGSTGSRPQERCICSQRTKQLLCCAHVSSRVLELLVIKASSIDGDGGEEQHAPHRRHAPKRGYSHLCHERAR